MVVALAGVLAYLAYRAKRRHMSRSMLFLAIGFAVMSVGTAVEGVLFELLNYEIVSADLVESAIVMVALLFMVYSVYGVKD